MLLYIVIAFLSIFIFFSFGAGWVSASKSSLFAKCKNFMIKLKRYSLIILRIIGVSRSRF